MKKVFFLLLLFLSPQAAQADELCNARTLGMGNAGRALLGGNDAIYLNPAGLSTIKQYAFSGNYFYSPKIPVLSGITERLFNVTIIDAQTQLVGVGVAYSRLERSDDDSGNRYDLAFSFPLSSKVFLGFDIKYLQFDRPDGRKDLDAVSGDVGLLLKTEFGLSLGVIGYNLTNPSDYLEYPVSLGAGVAYLFSDLSASVDWLMSFQKPKDPTELRGAIQQGHSARVGLEYLAAGQFTVRAGYRYEGTLPGDAPNWWSVGLGYVSPVLALDLGYRGCVTNASLKTFGVELRLFLPEN